MIDPPPPGPRAGWYGVFAELPGYQMTLRPPSIDPAHPGRDYGQTALYEWTGDAIKRLRVTAARGPGAVPEGGGAPSDRVDLGDRVGSIRDLDRAPADEPLPPRRRLEVPLALGVVLIFDAFGEGPWEDLAELAAAFDLDRIEEALSAPPRTDFRRDLETFRLLPRGASLHDLMAWLGPADHESSSDGLLKLDYELPDERRAILGVRDGILSSLVVVKPGGRHELSETLIPAP